MKKFFATLLGAFVGTWLAFIIFGIVIFISGIISMASFSMSSFKSNIGSVNDKSVLLIDLYGQIPEYAQTADFQMVINRDQKTPDNLRDILKAIKLAKTNDNIKGIVVSCNSSSCGFATAKAIRDALIDFKTSKKWIYAYGDAITQGDYYIASASDSIFMNPVGALEIHGITSSIPFFKNTLEKIGVEMQVIRVGTFKSAVEPYMLTEMSEANRLQTETYINHLWDNVSESIAQSRNIERSLINEYADSLRMFDKAEVCVKQKFIDGLCYNHEFESKVRQTVGIEEDDDINYVSVTDVLGTDKPKTSNNQIAVVYASGDIDVSGQKNGINSDDLVPVILDLAKDDDIKGMVLRVNSPGGSAFASEQIWEALEQFKAEGKKFAVSMGDYAASGGYYISCGADRIFAEPTTLTGSIGIFAVVPCAKGILTDKLGINFDFVQTNANSDISTVKPLTATQRNAFQRSINEGYELFTGRCAKGRNMDINKLKEIAEGRVWDATDAKQIGLVDELGNLDNAIKWVAKEAQIETDYVVSEYPETEPDFMDILLSAMSESYYKMSLEKQFGCLGTYMHEINAILNRDPIQCRMEYIEIK